MTENILTELRKLSGLKNCIIRTLTVYKAASLVKAELVTDTVFSREDREKAQSILRVHVPPYFALELEIIKLTPDNKMVEKRICEELSAVSKSIFSTLNEGDITVTRTDNGFDYKIAVAPSLCSPAVCTEISARLQKYFCGTFNGECVRSGRSLEDLETEEIPDEIEFITPVRTFDIEDFEILEGDKIQKRAIYISDLNMVSGEDVVVCGIIQDIIERKYVNKKGVEHEYLKIAVNDKSATGYITYFLRTRSSAKIRALKSGDSIVCTGVNEEYNGNLRYTAKYIDLGKQPKDFVPEKRPSKPVPVAYHHVFPQPYSGAEQTDLFNRRVIPACLKGKTFVVFDLETTGLNSSPITGNMDRIIEIGAYKIVDGEITESFSTFIDPQRKLSDEIISLTGITPEMLRGAPVYEDVMPDFYKFCYGSILVGHNIAGFDFKFVDYYSSKTGYELERKIIDTIPLSQELLFLSNYKLNTVAEKFGITFNHHRAIDDALATAKIFIELVCIKKSLPKF